MTTTPSRADAAHKLDTIRALLAKAEDPATTKPEAEAYFAKAADLMAKYGIDRALLAAAQPDTDRVGDRVFHVPPPYAYDKVILLHGIAEALGAKTVLIRAEGAGRALHVFAMDSDLERIDILFAALLVQAARFMAVDAYRRPAGQDSKMWKRDWLRGFSRTVRERLTEAEQRARADAQADSGGPSTALVLADRRALVDRRFAQQYPRVRNGTSRRRVGGGYGQGVAAGRRADLGGTRIGGTSRAAINR